MKKLAPSLYNYENSKPNPRAFFKILNQKAYFYLKQEYFLGIHKNIGFIEGQLYKFFYNGKFYQADPSSIEGLKDEEKEILNKLRPFKNFPYDVEIRLPFKKNGIDANWEVENEIITPNFCLSFEKSQLITDIDSLPSYPSIGDEITVLLSGSTHCNKIKKIETTADNLPTGEIKLFSNNWYYTDSSLNVTYSFCDEGKQEIKTPDALSLRIYNNGVYSVNVINSSFRRIQILT